MFFQRILPWTVLAAGAAASAYAIAAHGLLARPAWSAQGAAGMAAFSAAYIVVSGLLVWFAPRWFAPLLGLAVAGYSLVAAGPLAFGAALLVLLASYAAGALALRKHSGDSGGMCAAATLVGLGIWVALFSLTAGFRVHYWFTWLVPFLAAIAGAWSRQHFRPARPAAPAGREQALAVALPGLPLLAHWLAALKPEVGAEALAVHLTVPARMAAHHAWPFDVAEFAWAVKPFAGEWAFTLPYLFGGEAGARLLNVALAALVCWLLHGWLCELLPATSAALLTAAFASTPWMHQMAGSLRPENVAAAFLAGALFCLHHHLKTGVPASAFTAALLAGLTAATALGAAAFAGVLALAACLAVEWPVLLKSAPLALIPGLFPYWRAWQATNNPVFPHLSNHFSSQMFDGTVPLIPVQAWGLIDPAMWAGFGPLPFVLGPLCLIAIRPNWPRIATVLLVVWLAGVGLLAGVDGRVESLYVGLPVLVLSTGVMMATFGPRAPLLRRTLIAALAAALALQLCLLPILSPEHRDFALNQVLRPESVDAYLAAHAPERPLVRELNRLAPAERALWLDSDAVAGFDGQVLTNSWRHPLFMQLLRDTTSAEGLLFTAQELEADYFIAPAAGSRRPLTNVFFREFLDLYTKPQLRFAGHELRVLSPPALGEAPLQLAYAPPGRHDEVNSYVRYEGPWRRTFDFPQAYQGTLAYANDLRARIFIRFQGRAITVLHTAAANRCTGALSLDDEVETPFRQYAENTRWQASGPRLETAPGYHTLVIRLPVGRTTTTSVAECFLDFDGFIVE